MNGWWNIDYKKYMESKNKISRYLKSSRFTNKLTELRQMESNTEDFFGFTGYLKQTYILSLLSILMDYYYKYWNQTSHTSTRLHTKHY